MGLKFMKCQGGREGKKEGVKEREREGRERDPVKPP